MYEAGNEYVRAHVKRLLQGLQVPGPQLRALVVRERPPVQVENIPQGVLSPRSGAVGDPLLPQLGAEREPRGKAGIVSFFPRDQGRGGGEGRL